MDKIFAEDVVRGLSCKPKFLPSKYFYDEKGDSLFQQIMELDEYYLTNSEYSIFEEYASDFLRIFSETDKAFQLIEFGAGDGYKTKVLLKHFTKKNADFTYVPIDISKSVLIDLKHSLEKELPRLKVKGIRGDYFEVLKELSNHQDDSRNVILFLGSNIGNFSRDVAIDFMSEVRENLDKNDLFMVGFDLKKDPSKILKAYNDSQGITREFNLNLLDRINREFGGNFNRDTFIHYPFYNPASGEARSYLISTIEQDVKLSELDKEFHFDPWESIYMEVSKKFSLKDIQSLGEESGFKTKELFFDPERNFVNVVYYPD
jgi:dimethylhistidine N-methyltransferase